MIRYLQASEKSGSRILWEEAFPGDSSGFLDYYYREKGKNNRILVRQEGEQIVAMLHQNPYRIAVGGFNCRCAYLVAVATAANARRQGHMRTLMERSLADMRKEHMPFCFLMPASRDYYLPFLFADICQRPIFKLTNAGITGLNAVELTDDNVDEAARFMNRWLAKRYEVYTVRDSEYMLTLKKELESENGGLELLYSSTRLAGIRGEWGITKKEPRLLMCRPEYAYEDGFKEPEMMGRILDLPRFVQAVRLREETSVDELAVVIDVSDKQLPDNAGLWRWYLTKNSSRLERLEQGAGQAETADLVLDIAELTGWLFGYSIPDAARKYAELIRTLKGVYLDEEV